MEGAVRRVALALGLLVVLAAALSLGAAAEPAQSTGASARATAVRVTAPGQSGASTASVAAPPDAVAFGDGFAYPADGSIVRTGAVTASSSTVAGATATARASADATTVVLFNGEITADAVAARAKATATPKEGSGDFAGSTVTNLVALGTPVTAAPNGRFPLADWGYIVTLEQASVPGTPENGASHADSISALAVRLTADHGGLPAGSEILVGYTQATAEAREPAPSAVTVTTPNPSKSPGPKVIQPIVRTPPAKAAPDPVRPTFGGHAPVKTPPKVEVKLTPGRYVFPVYGSAGYGDTFGAPRADVSWHHGIDIFAPLGAPLLAVSDGIVYSVGWNDIGGNRLWLRDTRGNEYYYAHLSAFSPLAVNGAIVRAGDVLGFVGTTGDAEGTPPHLHFEIHPRQLLHMGYDGVVNAYPYLTAWQRVTDLRFPAFANGFAPRVSAIGNVPQAGAILLHATDISTASGLDPGSLEAVMSDAAAGEGDGSFVGPRQRTLSSGR
jgi:murein DD-endopeptidase MepM/ murein hydrolase activator NlpD